MEDFESFLEKVRERGNNQQQPVDPLEQTLSQGLAATRLAGDALNALQPVELHAVPEDVTSSLGVENGGLTSAEFCDVPLNASSSSHFSPDARLSDEPPAAAVIVNQPMAALREELFASSTAVVQNSPDLLEDDFLMSSEPAMSTVDSGNTSVTVPVDTSYTTAAWTSVLDSTTNSGTSDSYEVVSSSTSGGFEIVEPAGLTTTAISSQQDGKLVSPLQDEMPQTPREQTEFTEETLIGGPISAPHLEQKPQNFSLFEDEEEEEEGAVSGQQTKGEGEAEGEKPLADRTVVTEETNVLKTSHEDSEGDDFCEFNDDFNESTSTDMAFEQYLA